MAAYPYADFRSDYGVATVDFFGSIVPLLLPMLQQSPPEHPIWQASALPVQKSLLQAKLARGLRLGCMYTTRRGRSMKAM